MSILKISSLINFAELRRREAELRKEPREGKASGLLPFATSSSDHCCTEGTVTSWFQAEFNSLRHSAGPLAFGLQAQSNGCVKLVGVKGWFAYKWCVQKLGCKS
jgi:hypothetical protein